MKTNEQIFESIKGNLFNLLIDILKEPDYQELLNQLGDLFKTYFKVEIVDLYFYEENQFNSVSNFKRIENNQDPSNIINDSLMIRDSEQNPVALLLVKSTEAWNSFAVSDYIHELQLLMGKFLTAFKDSEARKIQSDSNHHLLYAMKKFNSTLETSVIFEQLINTVTHNLPDVSVELILSHEELHENSDYRLFNYANESDSTVTAFLTGELNIDEHLKCGTKVLNAPVKGKQGTYGILQLSAPADYLFNGIVKNFVANISESAGYAVENSSLYAQSSRLIRDLQLVNEVSKKLTGRLERQEMITYINEKLIGTFDHEEIAFVSLRDGIRIMAKETSNFFYTPAGIRYLDYVEQYIKKNLDATYIPDLNHSENNELTVYRSLIMTPMILADNFVGYFLMMHTKKYKYSLDDFKLAKAIVSHFSLALSNLNLREELQNLADKDQLTGLFSRRYLDNNMSRSYQNGIGGAFLLLDIDNFKLVNDRYGHAIGDQVLKQTAEVLQMHTKENGIAGRWGGEEFAIYLPSASLSKGKEVAKSILQQVPLATEPPVTISIGVNFWNPSTNRKTYQQLFQETDKALYNAKNKGKNQFITCDAF
ncbi:sensor domain-containing diguanylate cyclase [Sporosarcina aquimarina]|uniref:Sensor domain-containing diguanylate cyclase n=1 Tax=Sporosarcina aquimarina TaxID=114975 RepID=A0ABU4G043_9BACL|nr:sensor domain-containing diguanylate cyclase [Sporosarcina aquimarina]MDW0110338.1 sensor domain-containing diguanylate cyclase [Sporosarcina aquimarina]